MRRRTRAAVLCVGLAAGAAAAWAAQPPQSPQPSQRFAWWRSEQYQKNLGLTYEQVNRIEALFQAALPDLRKGRDELDRQEAELSRLIEINADEALVSRQVDKVEAIRSHLNKTRTLLLLHHRQVLTADQRVRLKAALDQVQADRAARERAVKPDEHKP